jgi:hypothetical protein
MVTITANKPFKQDFETLGALKKIIDVSDEFNRGFFTVVTSVGERRRHEFFCKVYYQYHIDY